MDLHCERPGRALLAIASARLHEVVYEQVVTQAESYVYDYKQMLLLLTSIDRWNN